MSETEIKNVVVVGHVDHGKSTFIGRLLLDTGNISADRLKDVEKTSAQLGRKLEFAYLMDQFQEERERNVTIDTTQAFMKIDGRQILMIDAPGHKEYLKNMITGATQAHQAIVMLDVNEGIREQTDKHARILKLLGIDRIAVCVNKMDTVGYSEPVFKQHKLVIESLFKEKGLPPPLVIPISAYNGENVSARSAAMSWYDGPTAIEFLKEDFLSNRTRDESLCFPVQLVYSPQGVPLALGRVENGKIETGKTFRLFPSNQTAVVEKILKFNEADIHNAVSGESVALQLNTNANLKRGDILRDADATSSATHEFSADVFWADEQPLRKGDVLTVECRTQSGAVSVQSLQEQLEETPLEQLAGGDVGRVTLTARDPLLLEPIATQGPLSRIVFHKNGQVAGCGVVWQILRLVLILFLFSSTSFAYVDPGTGVTFVAGIGGFIWGLITVGVGAVILTFKKWKQRVAQLFQSIKRIF